MCQGVVRLRKKKVKKKCAGANTPAQNEEGLAVFVRVEFAAVVVHQA